MTQLRSFRNCQLTKAELVSRMQTHYDLDELRQGATGKGNKGCTVWCSLHSYDHGLFPSALGLPEWLGRLVESIYERLPIEESKRFSVTWPKVIPEGSDLTLVENEFLEWLLIDPIDGAIKVNSDPSIAKVAALHRRIINGRRVTAKEWGLAGDSARVASMREAKVNAWGSVAAITTAAIVAEAMERAEPSPVARVAALVALDSATATAAKEQEVAKIQAQKLLELLAAAPVPDDLGGDSHER